MTVEVPFITVGNRQCLTGLQLAQYPELAAFVKKFPDCFKVDPCRDVYWFYPEGDANGSE
jgi:hypothetical protein